MATGKKIAVVCTGAVDGYAGAHIVQAGEDVTFIDFWTEHVEHMKAHGLTITHIREVEPFTVPVRALHITELQQISKEKPFDIAFVCTKSYDTAWAAMMIKQYLAPDGYVVSLQNCMNEETIAGVVGWGKTLGSIGRDVVKNDVIRHFSNRLGSEAIRVGQALGYTFDEVSHMDPETLARAGEGDAAAQKEIDEHRLAGAQGGGGEHRPSTGQDMVKGRRTEIPFLNGFVVRKGEEVGVPAPTNAILTDIVRRVEIGELKPDPKHITDLRLN